MNHQTPFLIALGMLTASALVVGVSGWILFVRDHATRKLSLASAEGGSTSVRDMSGASNTVPVPSADVPDNDASVAASVSRTSSDEHPHEVTEES
jgi:hypothetical protein